MALSATLNDQVTSMRAAAVNALCDIGGKTTIHSLQQALVDEKGSIPESDRRVPGRAVEREAVARIPTACRVWEIWASLL